MKKLNLVEVKDLFPFYLEYVHAVIADYNKEDDVRPVSFDEWYNIAYLELIHEYTMEHTFIVVSEGVSGNYYCRIPQGVFSESGGLLDVKLLDVMFERLRNKLPSVSSISIGKYNCDNIPSYSVE